MSLSRAAIDVAVDFEKVAVAAAGGDQDALEAIFERYSDDIYRWVYVKLRNHSQTEDVTAEVWLKVCRSIRTYQSTGHGFPAWLWTVTSNTIKSMYRTSGRELPTPNMLGFDQASDSAGPEDVALAAEMRSVVATALADLPKRQAECVTLRFFHRLSVAETASIMGVTELNVRQIQHRAIRKLSKLLPDPRARVNVVGVTQKGDSSARTQTDSTDRRGSS
jgi:RNA polymerase sigma-70 factor (ECF subfamily)